jgi:hypothetical protein
MSSVQDVPNFGGEDQVTVREIVDTALRERIGDEAAEEVINLLIRREDMIADNLRLAATQLGTFPELVAKVMADVGLGTPVDDDTKVMLDQQFVARIVWLQQQMGGQG